MEAGGRKTEGEREGLSRRKYLQNHEEYSAASAGRILSLSRLSSVLHRYFTPYGRYYIANTVVYLKEKEEEGGFRCHFCLCVRTIVQGICKVQAFSLETI